VYFPSALSRDIVVFHDLQGTLLEDFMAAARRLRAILGRRRPSSRSDPETLSRWILPAPPSRFISSRFILGHSLPRPDRWQNSFSR